MWLDKKKGKEKVERMVRFDANRDSVKPTRQIPVPYLHLFFFSNNLMYTQMKTRARINIDPKKENPKNCLDIRKCVVNRPEKKKGTVTQGYKNETTFSVSRRVKPSAEDPLHEIRWYGVNWGSSGMIMIFTHLPRNSIMKGKKERRKWMLMVWVPHRKIG